MRRLSRLAFESSRAILVAGVIVAGQTDPVAAQGVRSVREAESVFMRDSAGVRIVENLASRWTEENRWSLGSEPVLEIGVVEGEPQFMFSRIGGTRRLSDGSIVVLDAGSSELRFFDETGQYLRSVGIDGDGPGEFWSPMLSSSVWGDSLLVSKGSRRVTLVSGQGEVGRVFSLAEFGGNGQPLSFLFRFANGDLLGGFPSVSGHPGIVPEWGMTALVRFPQDGSTPTVLGESETVQCKFSVRGECAVGVVYGAIGGTRVHGDRIYTSRPDRNEVRVLDDHGRLVARILGARPIQPLTNADKEDFLDAIAESDPNRAAEIRAEVARSFSEVIPAFLRFIIDKEGHIWTQEYRIERSPLIGIRVVFPPRNAPIRWTIYDPEGIQLGEVEVPDGFSISEVGDDYVLGVFRDALGVERVQLYSLEKP